MRRIRPCNDTRWGSAGRCHKAVHNSCRPPIGPADASTGTPLHTAGECLSGCASLPRADDALTKPLGKLRCAMNSQIGESGRYRSVGELRCVSTPGPYRSGRRYRVHKGQRRVLGLFRSWGNAWCTAPRPCLGAGCVVLIVDRARLWPRPVMGGAGLWRRFPSSLRLLRLAQLSFSLSLRFRTPPAVRASTLPGRRVQR